MTTRFYLSQLWSPSGGWPTRPMPGAPSKPDFGLGFPGNHDSPSQTRTTGKKLRYIHRNPVRRGLVAKPEDWPWSSFGHYATGGEGVVAIESWWTRQKRKAMGTSPEHPRPSQNRA